MLGDIAQKQALIQQRENVEGQLLPEF